MTLYGSWLFDQKFPKQTGDFKLYYKGVQVILDEAVSPAHGTGGDRSPAPDPV